MRTMTVNVYKIDEVSDELKEKIIENFRNDPYLGDWAMDDGMRSLKAYCEHFGVTLKNYEIGMWGRSYAITDAENRHFRGLKLSACDRELMPTGYCIDWDFFSEFYDEFKRTGDAKAAFEHGLECGIAAIVRDCEDCYSEESIIASIEANEYEFLENGDIA